MEEQKKSKGENSIINENADFLFIYDATLTNPNGDPDRENKPRMDEETKTNLVTDTRLKRYIRDYMKLNEEDIFVDKEGHDKVSVDTRLINILLKKLDDEKFSKIPNNVSWKKIWDELRSKIPILTETNSEFYDILREIYKSTSKAKIKKDYKEYYELYNTIIKKEFSIFNDAFLYEYVKNKYIDIRMFGSAVAVAGFPRTVTGAIQLNWGYSFNNVELVESNSIVTTMNDGNSTFGQDYRLHYSLIGFHGTINKYAAKTTELREKDVEGFRKAIWESIPSQPTRSKMNQYPKMYLEIIYNDGYNNGHFGDLRNYIVDNTTNSDAKKARRLSNLDLDLKELLTILTDQVGENKPIKEYKLKYSADMKPYFNTIKSNLPNAEKQWK